MDNFVVVFLFILTSIFILFMVFTIVYDYNKMNPLHTLDFNLFFTLSLVIFVGYNIALTKINHKVGDNMHDINFNLCKHGGRESRVNTNASDIKP